VEDGLCLTSETSLFSVVSSFTLKQHKIEFRKSKNGLLGKNKTYLGKVRGLAGFILGNFMKRVLSALLSLAKGFSFFRNVDHFYICDFGKRNEYY
jgi:hypothetical protein